MQESPHPLANLPSMLRRLSSHAPLLGVLLLALALRVWGLGWGLPSATHYFSYHPDESRVLGAAMRMNLLRGDLLPHFYNYGSLQLYLVNFANTLVYLFSKGGQLFINDPSTQYPQWAHQYLVGRWLTVGMGVGTVWVTHALGARLWGRWTGLLAALLLAVTPLHAQHSHWLTVDVPATFWGILSLLWAIRLATGDPKSTRAALLSGLFAGLAAATKYNMALVLLPLALATFLSLRPFPDREGTGRLRPGLGLTRPGLGRPGLGLLGLLAALLAFLAACPGAVLDSRQFAADFAFEANHVQHLPETEFLHTGNGLVYLIARNLDAGLGLPLLLLCLLAVAYALGRRERGDGLLAAFALPYTVLLSLAAVRYARYAIPLLPVLALWAGRLLSAGFRLPHPARRSLLLTSGAAALLFTLADTILLIHPMTEPDNRDVALQRIEAVSPTPDAKIGFALQPWFYTPPLSPWFCAAVPGSWVQESSLPFQERIVYTRDWDAKALQTDPPPLVVLSEYEYPDALRLRDPAALAYLRDLRRDYRLTDIVAGASRLDSLSIHSGAFGLPTHDLPSDMLYTNPVILIYTRK